MIFNMVYGNSGSADAPASTLPVFHYTGQYRLIDDGMSGDVQNWRLKFLTSGTLNFTDLGGAPSLDLFLVGGGASGVHSTGTYYGGSGGGGGFARTERELTPLMGINYTIIVGDGGVPDQWKSPANGKPSSAFGHIVNGGYFGTDHGGGEGGSNGGDGGYYDRSSGGCGGSDGVPGQGTTTREFGEANGALYAGGGGGASGAGRSGSTAGTGGEGGGGDGAQWNIRPGANGEMNTGGGGGGGCVNGTNESQQNGSGGSGIVILRNHRA